MVLRWVHKGWKVFWKVVLSILVIILVVGGGALGLLQLDSTKDVIVEKIENDFRKNYEGRLEIGELNGFLPFNAELKNVSLTSTMAGSISDTLASVESAKLGIDVWALLQNKLSIDAFNVDGPSIRLLAGGNGSYTLGQTLQKKQQKAKIDTVDQGSESWIKNVEIIAPQVTVDNGSLYIERFYDMPQNINLPEPLRIIDINARMFVELTTSQRYVEVNNFTADARNMRAGKIEVSGQVYNDDEVLEFNAFHLTLGTSHMHLNGNIGGVNVYEGALRDQFSEAQYDIQVSSHRLKLSEFTDVLSDIPNIEEPFDFTFQTNGTMESLELNTFRLGVGESYFSIGGQVDHLFNKNLLAYNFNIDTLDVRNQDVEIFTGPLNAKQYRALEDLRLNGQANGTADSLIVDVSGSSTLGSFDLDGEGQLKSPFGYQGQLTGRNIDIGPIVASGIDTTNLNFSANINGQNTSLHTGRMHFVASAQNSFINDIRIDSLRLTTSLEQGNLNAEYYYRNENQLVSGEGSADFNQDDPPIKLNGRTKNVNLDEILANAPIDSTSLNTEYEIDMRGTDPDRMQGMASFEVEPSIINGDSVDAHRIRVELDSPDLASRTLQINSSLFDLKVTGDLKPSNISNQVTYWSNYFKERIAAEIRLDSTKFIPDKLAPFVEPLNLRGNLETKNLTLVKKYWPSFPSLISNSKANFEVRADSSDLKFSSQINSDTLRINTVQIDSAGSHLSGKFNYNSTLKEYATLSFKTNADRIESNLIKMDSVAIDLNYRQDSLYYSQRVKQFSDNARFNLQMRSKLSDQNIQIAIDEFFLGNDEYAWQNESTAQITYNRAKEVIFESFQFENQDEYFALQGTLSPEQSDSLRYIIRDVNLARISDLVKGEFNFAGRLNGTLQTRSLTQTPSIQGDLTINRLQIQDRLVGDIDFKSEYNEDQKRFDTRLEILTDSTKYRQYFAANSGVGQNIVLDGYFVPSDLESDQDSVFYFDADFNEIDMWVVQLITQNIFTQLEGSATGSGYISGNLQDINYSADFEANDVYARPQFLLTNYYLDGHIEFNDEEGVVLDDISIRDNQGGTGTLNGNIDLNDFKPITFIDLQMDLNDLSFLENRYTPDVPFYGTVAGTGNISLSGSNTDMTLRSLNDIRVSESSTLSIPLMGSTELSSSGNFIQFVKTFDELNDQTVDLSEDDVENVDAGESRLERAMDNLTFSDRFNIDLQFNAPDPINMRLIFDRVTGEKMVAEGTGRLRISMEEGNTQMFGNFNVAGGRYQFVSGDIFSRELDIRSGGSIVWQGPADNAQLDIEAVYHARPTLGSLRTTEATEEDGPSRRIPVDLIVDLTGTLNSVENEYHFELPTSFETTSGSLMQFRLNQINSDDQQKLLQATSILLTGNFLATGQASMSQTEQLSQSITRGSTFINPILSNQVISPLLSSQINALLDSDATQFDVDFQINRFNQIDLGIALRLYNDKLILRREGYLTGGGAESRFGERIGDLSATYRINSNLSLTAFHRLDQTFTNVAAGNQANDFTPTVDGLGVEAQVQFNTWQQLGHKVQNFFRRLVGMEEIDFEEREQAQKENTEKDTNITEKQN